MIDYYSFLGLREQFWIDFILDRNPEKYLEQLKMDPVYAEKLEGLQWAAAAGLKIWIGVEYKTAYYGNREGLEWIRDNHFPLTETTCSGAARGGQLEILKWARNNRVPWDEDTTGVPNWV